VYTSSYKSQEAVFVYIGIMEIRTIRESNYTVIKLLHVIETIRRKN